MAKRRIRGKPSTRTKDVSSERLGKALARKTKAELIALLVEVAEGDVSVFRRLEADLNIVKPQKELIAATREAIRDATAFDEREMGYNFDYDHQAYALVEKNFQLLIEAGNLEPVMEMALELMTKGSYQVEMSDEGMMTTEVQDCLAVVVDAVEKAKLSNKAVATWAKAMLDADRVGFLCRDELTELTNRLK